MITKPIRPMLLDLNGRRALLDPASVSAFRSAIEAEAARAALARVRKRVEGLVMDWNEQLGFPTMDRAMVNRMAILAIIDEEADR